MQKVINVKPAEEIVIKDPFDGKEYHGFFNMRCLLFFQELLKDKSITKDTIKDYDLPAMCLYAVLNTEDQITYEEAEKISRRMGPASGSEIINMFSESLMDSLNEQQKEMLKKTMARYVMQTMKKK